MIRSPANSIFPSATRYAPRIRAAAAPIVIAQSVIPLDRTFVPKTHIVFWNRSRAFTSRLSALLELCPNDFSVAKPWIESKNSDANAA